MKKIILIPLGFLLVGLGILGMIFPFIPTVPFLLAASYCFAKSSDRLDNWFKQTKIYKKHLESFTKGQGMPLKSKIIIMTFITALMAFGFIMMKNTIVGRIILGVVWLFHVILFAFIIKTKKEEQTDQQIKD